MKKFLFKIFANFAILFLSFLIGQSAYANGPSDNWWLLTGDGLVPTYDNVQIPNLEVTGSSSLSQLTTNTIESELNQSLNIGLNSSSTSGFMQINLRNDVDDDLFISGYQPGIALYNESGISTGGILRFWNVSSVDYSHGTDWWGNGLANYWFFNNATSNAPMVFGSNDDVGLGTVIIDSSPSDLITSSSLFIDATNENVGIGTVSPTSKLHVNGTALFAGLTTFENRATFEHEVRVFDDVKTFYGSSTDASFFYSTAQTNDSMLMGLRANTSRALIITTRFNEEFDHAHPDEINPIIFLHSANQSTTEWTSISNDGDNGLLNVGTGYLRTVGGQGGNTTQVNVATYDLLVNDYFLAVDYTATGAVTSLTLPTAQCNGVEDDGREIIIKDTGGNATANSITIDTEGIETIDGVSTRLITVNDDSRTLTCYSSNWYIN